MITRIEIDGFKSFVDFSLDVPPFLVLVGANNGGKSNLLEAVGLVTRVASSGARNTLFARAERGNVQELFHRDPDGEASEFFEIRLGFGAPARPGEAAASSLAVRVNRMPKSSFVTTFTENPPGERHREFDAIRWLALSPTAMRNPAAIGDERPLAADGSNLAAVIGRLKETGDLSDLLIDATAVIKDLRDIEPRVDTERAECDFSAEFGRGGRFGPSLLSDGTLRVLAILAAIHDRTYPVTLLIDEVETGLHPECLWQLLQRLRARTSDGSGRQVIATTHSPVAVGRLMPEDSAGVRYLSQWTRAVRRPDGELILCSYTRALAVQSEAEPGTSVSAQEVRTYLGTQPGADR